MRPPALRLSALGVASAAMLGVAAARATDEALEIQGKISPDIRYILRIDYVTTVNDPACQFQDQITGMSVSQRESRYERPTIDGGSHSLRVVTSWSGRLRECAWRPAAVFICAGPRPAADADLNCRSLMLLTASGSSPRQHVSLGCPPPTWYCLSADGKDPTEQVGAIAGSMEIDLASGLRLSS
jgi:hypothetical protein